MYKGLSNGHNSAAGNEETELRINSGAADAQLEWKREGYSVQKKKFGREDLEAFETAYNAACVCIARGEFGQGEILLKRAEGRSIPKLLGLVLSQSDASLQLYVPPLTL